MNPFENVFTPGPPTREQVDRIAANLERIAVAMELVAVAAKSLAATAELAAELALKPRAFVER